MVSATWIFVLTSALFSCVIACPPEHLIRPCRCQTSEIACKGIVGQDILDGVFRRIGNSKVTEFIIKDSQFDYIPLSSIEQNDIRRILVIDSVVGQLFEREPSTGNEVVHLRLDNVTLRNGLDISQLRPLHRLEILVVKNTEIPVIEQEFRESLSSKIKLVSFFNTKTHSIDMAFVGKQELEDVRIQNNYLTVLNRITFPYPSNRLQGLSFDGNQIETLPDDQFLLMDQLRRVSLAHNRISQVSEKVFGEVFDQLKFLILHGNPIKCDCSIKWLTMRNSEGKTITGKCVEPQSLAGRSIADLKASDFPDC